MKRILICLILLVLSVGQTLAHARTDVTAKGLGSTESVERVCWRKQMVGPIKDRDTTSLPVSCQVVAKFPGIGLQIAPPPLRHAVTPRRTIPLSGNDLGRILRPPIG